MDYRPLLGAGAYLGVTFPLAILWHVVAFRPTYDQLGYFERDPIFALGFLAILVGSRKNNPRFPHHGHSAF